MRAEARRTISEAMKRGYAERKKLQLRNRMSVFDDVLGRDVEICPTNKRTVGNQTDLFGRAAQRQLFLSRPAESAAVMLGGFS